MAFAFPVTELTLRVGDTPLPYLGQQFPAPDHQLPILPAIDVESLFSGNRNTYFQDQEQAKTSESHVRNREITRNSSSSGRKRHRKLNTNEQSHGNGPQSQRRRRQFRPKQSMRLAHNYETGADRFQTGVASANENRGTSIARIVNSQISEQNSQSKSVSQVHTTGRPLMNRRGGAEPAIKTKSTEAQGTIAKEVSKLDHRSGQLPVDLPQQLLLTPIGPLEWRQMVADSKTPHFLLVPATPLKATWMNGGDTASLSPQFREKDDVEGPKKAPSSDNKALHTHSNRHFASLQPTHVTSRIEIHGGVSHNMQPPVGAIKHFGSDTRKATEFTESNPQFQSGNQGRDQINLEGKIIFRNEKGENSYSVIKIDGNKYAPEQRETQILHNNNNAMDAHNLRPHYDIPFDHRRSGAEIGGDSGFINIDNVVQRVPEIHEHGSGTVYLQENTGAENNHGTNVNQIKFHSSIQSSSSNNHVSTDFGNDGSHARREQNGLWITVPSQSISSGDPFSVDNSGVGSPNQNNEFDQSQNYGQYVGKMDWPGSMDTNGDKPLTLKFNNVDNYGRIIQISDFEENQDRGITDIDKHDASFHLFERENGDYGTSVNYDENIYIAGGSTEHKNINTNHQTSNLVKDPSVQFTTGAQHVFDMNKKDMQIISAIPTRFAADTILETGSQSLRGNFNTPQVGEMSEAYPSSNHVPTDQRIISEETNFRRLQNPFGELTNKNIVNNRDLTTRYSKSTYSSNNEPTGNIHSLPTHTMIRHDGHLDELQKQIENEHKTNSHHPSSFHVQTFTNSNSLKTEPQASKIQSPLQGTRRDVDNEMKLGSKPVNHVPIRYKFTEHDAATRPHQVRVTSSQRGHRQRTSIGLAKNNTHSLTPILRANAHLTSEDNFKENARQDDNFSGSVLRPTISSSSEPRKEKINIGQDVYQSANNIHSTKLQSFLYDTSENMNLFEAVQLRSSQMPVTYIEYTTQRSVTEPRFVKKDSSGRPRFENNPFFNNFGPFPQLKLKSQGAPRNSSDKIVFVTPAPARSKISEILKQSQFTDPEGAYFIPLESTGQHSEGVAFLETSAHDGNDAEISKDAEIELGMKHKNTSARESHDILNENETGSLHDMDGTSNDASEFHSYENFDRLSFSKNNQNNLETEEGEPVVKNESNLRMNGSDSKNSAKAQDNDERSKLKGKDSWRMSELKNGTGEADERHYRTGGALLDALVDMVKKASSDESLQDMLPPFSVLEVGVGERLAEPELSADSPEGFNHTLSPPTPAPSAFTSMLQLGIVLGVVIMVAVLLFHAPRLRRELCSKEKRERLRRLKQRYAQDAMSSSSSEFSSTSFKPHQDGGDKNQADSHDEKSDRESHYARVLDVSL